MKLFSLTLNFRYIANIKSIRKTIEFIFYEKTTNKPKLYSCRQINR